MKKIILTGGGTAGHVTPNLALIPALKKRDYEIRYIGSYQGIEKRLAENAGIPYDGISSGKLRRYFDLKNFSDPFRVLKGYGEACRLLKKYQPDVIFSKGGFVSVPVVLAAKRYRVPTILHESDMTPGLANRLCIPSAAKICCNFPETLKSLPAEKSILTGSPIREELLHGNKEAARKLCGFHSDKPVLMIIGGSLGSAVINQSVREALPKLLDDFQIVHICGKDKIDNLLLKTPGYKQFEYVKDDLKDIFAMADIVVSRAGANAICELLALKKPNLLIPLSAGASRGDQILNARSFEAQGFSMVIDEDYLSPGLLIEKVHALYCSRQTYIDAMEKSRQTNAIPSILEILNEITG